jgi:hypothetical protein
VRLKVIHQNGEIETLSLRDGAWTIVQGEFLDRLWDGSVEHFFTKDGYYDGWGGAVNATPAEAVEIIETMDERRDVARLD